MTDPFKILCNEYLRFVDQEAGGDFDHPGARLRFLLALKFSADENFVHMRTVAHARGMLPACDRGSGRGLLTSPGSFAAALGASIPYALYLLEEVCAFCQLSGIPDVSMDVIFPDEPLCTLH